jgi:hypothetical protein
MKLVRFVYNLSTQDVYDMGNNSNVDWGPRDWSRSKEGGLPLPAFFL